MNKELSERLVKFAEGPVASGFLDLAEETFLADFAEEMEAETFSDVMDIIGEYGRIHVVPCLMEFFFSNDYQSSPDNPDDSWNAIDCFLQERKSVTAKERRYLEGLRDSHMSLYRVAQAGPKKHLKLYDMIELKTIEAEGSPDMVAKMRQGDVFGIRVIDLGETKAITGILLPFETKRAKRLADDLRDLLSLAMKAIPLAQEQLLTERDRHLVRVMLAPEIATAFMQDMVENKSFLDTLHALATARPQRRKKGAAKQKRPAQKRKSRKT